MKRSIQSSSSSSSSFRADERGDGDRDYGVDSDEKGDHTRTLNDGNGNGNGNGSSLGKPKRDGGENKKLKLRKEDKKGLVVVDKAYSAGEGYGEEPQICGMEIISQGAEAKIYTANRIQHPSERIVVKERFTKLYRHPALEKKLASSRLLHEAKILKKVETIGIDAPKLIHMDKFQKRLYLEFIDGTTVKEVLRSENTTEEVALQLAVRIGEAIAQLHAGGIIHGDLTTSNMMLRYKPASSSCSSSQQQQHQHHQQPQPQPQRELLAEKVVLLDFGLASMTKKAEEMGVDLYVLERAFNSTHPNSTKLVQQVLQTYQDTNGSASKSVIETYEKVRLRGRKRVAFG